MHWRKFIPITENNIIVGSKEIKNMKLISTKKFYDLYIRNCSINLTTENVISKINLYFRLTL